VDSDPPTACPKNSKLKKERPDSTALSSGSKAVALYEMIFSICRTFSMYFMKKCFWMSLIVVLPDLSSPI
jgi:hypothetical protein